MAKKREKEWRISGYDQPNQHQPGTPDSVRCPGWPGGEVAALGNRQGDVAINHRTIRWCTGLSGESSVPAQALRRRTRRSREKEKASRLKFTGLSGEPTAPAANDHLHDQRATRGWANDRMVTPDCPMCTRQCLVRQWDRRPNGQLHPIRKEIGHRTAIVHVRWCTRLSGASPDRRQELPSNLISNRS
jgi:hypothetical protein